MQKVNQTVSKQNSEVELVQEGTIDIMQFRSIVATLSPLAVAKKFIELHRKHELVSSKACYDELLRLGYAVEISDELLKLGISKIE